MWLRATGRNQSYLAQQMGYTKGYISHELGNLTKISFPFYERILKVTHIRPDLLFHMDGAPDTRQRFGEVYVFNGETLNHHRYLQKLRSLPNVQKIVDNYKLP